MPEYPTDWDFYITYRNGELASVMVNLALRDVAPIENLTDCMTIRVPLLSPNEQGLCTAEERPQADLIEDALRDAFAADGKWLFAGRRITGGKFELVYFGHENGDADPVIARVMSRFPEYEAESTIAPDPAWDAYCRELFPGQVELRQILNQRSLRRLEAQGEDLSQERPVQHRIDFPNALARADFVAALEGRGFQVEEVDSEQSDAPHPFGLHLSRSDPLDHSSINELTLDLLLLAEQYEGAYQEWTVEA